MTTKPADKPDQDRLREWHRAFGIALVDLFADVPWRVELEQELALTSQELDVAIIEAAAPGCQAALPDPLPDGLENLRAINLLSYKSRHEAHDVWSLDELIGYYVLYRKINLDTEQARHPLDAFGLYAVATRYPERLARSHALQPTAWEGVYELPWGGHQLRIIVLNRIAKHPRNAPWELFASEQDRMRQGLEHYRQRLREPHQDGRWKLLERLHLIFQREAPEMAYTLQDFIRETDELWTEDVLKRNPELILKHLDPELRLKGLDPEQRLKGLDPATIEAWLAKQRRDH